MILCDSNILIYAANAADQRCAPFVERNDAAIAAVCRIEVLGFQGFGGLLLERQQRLMDIVGSMIEIPLNDAVIVRAITLRQQRRMQLGDAIVAATALVHGIPLVTRNVVDFRHLRDLRLINPFEGAAEPQGPP